MGQGRELGEEGKWEGEWRTSVIVKKEGERDGISLLLLYCLVFRLSQDWFNLGRLMKRNW